jgi:CheY-like chemotaxis protein
VNGPSNILLVDDDRQVVRYLKRALEEGGYTVIARTSGKEALAAIHERMPDLLILDLNMPEPDGFDLLKTERSKFPYLRILVILDTCVGPYWRLQGSSAPSRHWRSQ